MHLIEIKKLSIAIIKEKLKTLNTEYKSMKFNHKGVALSNPIQLRNTRRIIARMSTILRQKILAMSNS